MLVVSAIESRTVPKAKCLTYQKGSVNAEKASWKTSKEFVFSALGIHILMFKQKIVSANLDSFKGLTDYVWEFLIVIKIKDSFWKQANANVLKVLSKMR